MPINRPDQAMKFRDMARKEPIDAMSAMKKPQPIPTNPQGMVSPARSMSNPMLPQQTPAQSGLAAAPMNTQAPIPCSCAYVR